MTLVRLSSCTARTRSSRCRRRNWLLLTPRVDKSSARTRMSSVSADLGVRQAEGHPWEVQLLAGLVTERRPWRVVVEPQHMQWQAVVAHLPGRAMGDERPRGKPVVVDRRLMVLGARLHMAGRRVTEEPHHMEAAPYGAAAVVEHNLHGIRTLAEVAHQLMLQTRVAKPLRTLVLGSKRRPQAHILRLLQERAMAINLHLVLTEVLHITLQPITQRLEVSQRRQLHTARKRLQLRTTMRHVTSSWQDEIHHVGVAQASFVVYRTRDTPNQLVTIA